MSALSSSAWWLSPNPVSFHDEVAQCPAEMGCDLAWRVLGSKYKSLAGRGKGTSLTLDRVGQHWAGARRKGWRNSGGTWAAGHSPLWRGTQRSLLCVSCNKTSPRHQDTTGWSAVAVLLGTRSLPTAAAPLTFRASWKMGTPG